jgi:hypothetical protein
MPESSHEAATIVAVVIPSPLRSYTRGRADVSVAVPLLAPESPPSLSAVLAALDGAFHGLRFRIVDELGHLRPHIRVFIGNHAAKDLKSVVPEGETVMIVAALSGG